MSTDAGTVRLECRTMGVDVDRATGRWALTDKRSGVRWPTASTASAGNAQGLQGGFATCEATDRLVRLAKPNGCAVVFELVDGRRTLEIRYEGKSLGEVRALADAIAVTDGEDGMVIVPCREGLLVSARSGKSWRRTFGTSDYEGCHMNMMGFLKGASALVVSWDDAYTFPEVQSSRPRDGNVKQRVTTTFRLARTARTLRLTPLGKGDWNTVAAGYRRIAEQKGLAATLREKIKRNAKCEGMVGAANVKLWTCLARRMSEDSTKEESVRVRWTFDEAAQIAEHLKRDVGIDRCLFILGGWSEGGYDCRHPDNLPANPECGGDKKLSEAIARIQKLGYVACLHDNVQDMYRDAKSFDLKYIEKDAKGNPKKGGRWLGGRAWMVCAPKQLELAQRPQNLPETQRRFKPLNYFIDTTYAVGPRECADPAHPIGRNEDIAWKAKLSDYARDLFGLFGSECGREWALPHSDWFEGLVAVSGRYYHGLDPIALGATVIPFWEMVYHDCQIAYGKYGYDAADAAEYVVHHVLCARPLHYHSLPDHLYWKAKPEADADAVPARPRVVGLEAAGDRAFRIRYAWDVEGDVGRDWRVFVHFGTSKTIRFQDDHEANPATSRWRKGQSFEVGPRGVTVPASLQAGSVDVYIGLFDPQNIGRRARLPGCDGQRRILAGRLHLKPAIRFERLAPMSRPDRSCFTRSDGGWAAGMHPTDVFLKNTQEVLGPLHEATAHATLTRFEFLSPDRAVRRATYGTGQAKVVVVANLGRAEAEVPSRHGGTVRLPQWGFAIDAPQFAAFHATRWGGRDYPGGALFTLRATGKAPLAEAKRVRIFHAFGDATIRWAGGDHRVARERTVSVSP